MLAFSKFEQMFWFTWQTHTRFYKPW